MFSLLTASHSSFLESSNTTNTYSFLSVAIEALNYWISGSNPLVSAQIQTLVEKTKRSEENSWESGSRYLRHLTAPEGEEFQVNTYTLGDQMYPAIAGLADGGYVIAWQSADQGSAEGYGIFARRYTSAGKAYGSEFLVNTYTTYQQQYPAIAALPDGGFVIAWQSSGQDGSYYGIYAQRYTSTGTAYGSEFQVNTYTTNDQMHPAIASLTDGGFVITWQSADQDGSFYGVYAQRYKSSNEAYNSEFRVNSYTTKDQKAPTIAGLSDGGFVIAWQSASQDGSYDGVYAQRYTSSSDAYGLEFQVNTYTTSTQDAPAISGLSDGGFVITWESYSQYDWSYDIYAQRYTSLNIACGLEYRVNTYTTHDQKAPAISNLSDGGFVITWTSLDQDGSFSGVYAQRYTSSNLPYGTEFQVNTYTNNNQDTPAITGLSEDGYVITWEGSGQDGSFNGIYGKQFSTAEVVDETVKSTPESSKPVIKSNSLFVIISIALPVSVLAIAGYVFCFRAKKTENLSDSPVTFYYKPLLEKSSKNDKFLGMTKNFSF